MGNKNDFIKIYVDTLGSETSIKNIIRGLNSSYLRNDNYFFRLFGSKKEISHELKKYNNLINNIEIIDCNEKIEMSDKPSDVIKTKKNSSMNKAIVSVIEKDSKAVLSCGNTGALMAM